MSRRFKYTTLAHRYTARFPVLTYVATQANFWIIANVLLVIILNWQSKIIGLAFGLPVVVKFGTILRLAVILGVVYGVSLGLIGYYLERGAFKKLALGKIILFKAMVSLALLILLLWLLRFVFLDLFIPPSAGLPETALTSNLWGNLFNLLVSYYFFMTLLISFINQINRKFGPGILVPLLLGRYRNPREDERIFMFMDLKSSTATAEKLGHLKYSSFIRDCFADISEVLMPFRAQVYQYVGDEIVVTWQENEGLKDLYCIRFYFACQKQFHGRSEYYLTNYGFS